MICSTSWNLLPRWQRRSDAPCAFRAVMRGDQRAQARAVDERDVVHVQDNFLFALGDQAFSLFRAARCSLRQERCGRPAPPRTRHPLPGSSSSMPRVFLLISEAVPAATRAGTTQLINNSPRRTCNIRRPGKSTCNAATPAAASTPDNSAKHLPPRPPRSLQLSLREASCIDTSAASR